VGGQALAVVAEVTRRDHVQRILEAALARFGQVDVGVNNAAKHALNALTSWIERGLRHIRPRAPDFPDVGQVTFYEIFLHGSL
jgi:NAD(P)-dependent dehydrogenase (short-subunit alcohol dehydrogenase family)